MKEIFYMAGLPRSGSTLLMNILAQRPDVHATPTSGLVEIVGPIKNGWHKIQAHTANKELSSSQSDVLRAVMLAYHKTDKPFIIDKSRGWGKYMEMLEEVFGKRPKVIAPVRSFPQIMASFEKLHRKNAVNRETGAATVEKRVEEWASAEGMLGAASDTLKDALARGYRDSIAIVEYGHLTTKPDVVLKELEAFLGLEPFTYDFENVEQKTHEDDSVYGFNDLHTIRQKVAPVQDDSQEILGQQLTKQLMGSEFWR